MRNYSVLEDIYLGDIEKIEANKGKMDITLSECVLAVKCYSQNQNKLNLGIAKIIFDEYTDKHNSKEDINDLINLAKGVSYNGEMLIGKMVRNEHIKKFLSENKFNTTDYIDENLRLDAISQKDKLKINTLIEIEGFKKVLQDKIDLEEVGSFIDLAKESADIVINKNKSGKGYAPLAVLLAEDVVDTLVSNRSEGKKIDSDLWKDVKRYDLTSIKNADLEEMSGFQGPQHLASASKEPIYEAIWALTQNGDLKFASTYHAYGNHRQTSHADLANGESIISAGMAYFSADKSTLLAIDNKSGHYQPSAESVFKSLPILERSDINIENTITSDFGWTDPMPFKKQVKDDTSVEITIVENFGVEPRKSNSDVIDRVGKIRAKSFPQFDPDNKNSLSPKLDK